MSLNFFEYHKPFELESGRKLPGFTLAYTIYGNLNKTRDNVVWITHALTANSEAAEWWEGLVGIGKLFDPENNFIICANVLGGCYGSTGPLTVNPDTGNPRYQLFPTITIRDIVNAFILLRKDLKIKKIQTLIGGSLGGQQALEWSVIEPEIIENLILIATNAKHSAWGIAFNEAQRLAIKADPTWHNQSADAAQKGLKAARAIALLSYRNSNTYNSTQSETQDETTDGFKASSYQNYQGEKLIKRFNAYSYWVLSKTMDSHNVGRGRGGVKQALSKIQAKTHVIGIKSDILFPVNEQQFLAENIPGAEFHEIDSFYGHDGFLIESQAITNSIKKFLNKQQQNNIEYEFN
jgi:homoserine O-acetyltransferase/O-succinyltransferase